MVMLGVGVALVTLPLNVDAVKVADFYSPNEMISCFLWCGGLLRLYGKSMNSILSIPLILA